MLQYKFLIGRHGVICLQSTVKLCHLERCGVCD